MSTDPDLCVVMETLDEYRNELPEGTYIRVCTSIKNLHNKLKKPKIVLPRLKEICVPVAVATVMEILKRIFSRT
jgi:hypothetical protein